MQFFIIFLLLGFLVFLFTLYMTGREDIVFIRKNITTEILFDNAFLAVIVGMLSARLVHALLSLNPEYLNPLIFLLFPYFPGLSLSGGVFGAALFLTVILRYKKMPVGRVLDYFALSLLSALPVGYVGKLFLTRRINVFENVYLPVVYLILFLFFLKIIYPRVIRNELKSGSLGMFFLFTFSFISLLITILNPENKFFFFVGTEDIIAFFFFVGSLLMLIKQEMLTLPGRK